MRHASRPSGKALTITAIGVLLLAIAGRHRRIGIVYARGPRHRGHPGRAHHRRPSGARPRHTRKLPRRPDRVHKAGTPALAALGAAAALMAGCGEENTEVAAQKLAPAGAIEADPYTIACGHVRDQQAWADVTRRATVAIADRERIPELNRLQSTQSLFFAMTELCKGRPASYQPAEAAVNGVRSGEYRADLGSP